MPQGDDSSNGFQGLRLSFSSGLQIVLRLDIMDIAVLDCIGFQHSVQTKPQQEYSDPLGVTVLLIALTVAEFR